MTRNCDFSGCIEERKNKGFFKVLQSANLSSENMRAIPHDFVRSFSDNELSGKMKIRAKWGRTWEIEICKNSRFYFMEKSGWDKFVRDNSLGNNEFITFTHKRTMLFTVNIFTQDEKEMLQPRQSAAFLASSSRIKTEHGEDSYKDVMKEEVLSSDLSYLGSKTAAESNGRGKYKRNINLGKKKANESQDFKKTKKVFSVQRDSAGASSSSVAEFTVLIYKSYLNFLIIPASVVNDHMPEERAIFKIHHPDMKKSWQVVYTTCAIFSGGWRRVAREYPLAVGDTCKFTFIKPTELLLVVSKS